jgi:DNA-binding IscR family transcriptional regulator
VHDGIFNGVRGPRGGYQLARERKRITVAEILRAAGSVTEDEDAHTGSRILEHAVVPSLADAERAFATALSRLSLDEIVRRAETLPRT